MNATALVLSDLRYPKYISIATQLIKLLKPVACFRGKVIRG